MTSTGCSALAFLHSELSDRTRPDIQLHLASFSLATDYGLVLKDAWGESMWWWVVSSNDMLNQLELQ